jgi:GR25 family glycosyltransferase involved in LPS biosynthesis
MKNSKLRHYLEIIWPILNYCTINIFNEFDKPNINEENKHIWYLYRQAFYGFSNYVNPKQYYSKKAAEYFEKIVKEKKLSFKSLEEVNWENQHLIDDKREYLILEHMYTGTMFRLDVLALHKKNKLTIDEVSSCIYSNYNICWIQKNLYKWDDENKINKPENNKIHKTKRIGNLFDYYKECGIEIVNL